MIYHANLAAVKNTTADIDLATQNAEVLLVRLLTKLALNTSTELKWAKGN